MTGATAALQGMRSADPALLRSANSPRADASFESVLSAAQFPTMGKPTIMPLDTDTRFSPIEIPKRKAIALELRSSNKAIPLGAAQSIDETKLRDSAKKLVASALLTPLLEEMQNSSLRPTEGPFAKNIVEKRFGPLMHQHMADRMMQSNGRSMSLVDAVIKRMGGSLEVTV